MKILAVETATSVQSVAVMEDDAVLARSDEPAAGAHGRTLLPVIDRLLAGSGLTLSDLSGLALSIGPGSFTGLRVGLATLMGFRSVTKLPLVTVPTLEALAWNLRGELRPVCPLLKARTGELYWAMFHWQATGRLTRLSEDRVGSLASWAESITGPVVVLGEGWLLHREALRRLGGERTPWMVEAPLSAMGVSAVSVGLAARERFARGEVAGEGIAPTYVQRAEAELKWAANAMANAER